MKSVTIDTIPTISETNDCDGCIFQGKCTHTSDYKEAMIILGLRECSDGFIYIINDHKEML